MAQSQMDSAPANMGEQAQDPRVRVGRSLFFDLFGPPPQRNFTVRYWDGSVEGPDTDGHSRFTVVLKRPGSLRRMFLPPSEVAIGEAYLRDDFDIEGSVEDVTRLGESVGARVSSPRMLLSLAQRLFQLPADDAGYAEDSRGASHLAGSRHSRRRDAAAVRYHYDVGNEFYALWLDARMVYSCAYFPTGAESLDAAQEAKLEHICRKLRLKPGERLLDIGCGWGGLLRYAAGHYGVEALGVTLSEPQAELARRRIAEAGLGDRCRIEVRDYRDLAPEVPFDKVVSVGMFEHVGRAQLPTYFATAYRLTRPGGLFLNHGIAAADTSAERHQWLMQAIWRPGAFIQRYVFPDGELIPPAEAIAFAEHVGWETRDVENLREHYALTLRHWVRRLEQHHAEATKITSEATYRVWRLYMSGSARSFADGRLHLIQALYSKPGPSGFSELPLTRADLYQ
jgi:cyclopropane-fatty-acyl-phospholipid synthase